MEITILPVEMRQLEQAYMAETGVPGALLMEHAAQGVCRVLHRRVPGGRVLFLCGPGNNGGDGYAAARLWQAEGGSAAVLELSDHPGGDAGMNRTLAMQCGVPVTLVTACPDELPPCDAVVDALFGTGLSRGVDGVAAALIRLVNGAKKPVIAVDIPSGVDGADGMVRGAAIVATETVTFHRLKPGLVLQGGVTHAGRITVAPILIPQDYGTQEGLRSLTPEDLPRMIPPRPVDGHKGTFGHAVLLVGSVGMAGAAAMCANACIRAGSGLTTVLCRPAILPIVQSLAPGAVCIPLEEQDGHLTAQAAVQAANALDKATAAAVGCGLGQTADVLPLLSVFAKAACPTVWDADALNLLSTCPDLRPGAHAVMTPHPGEAARLLACTTAEVTADPVAALQRLSDKYGCHVLLKGARTLMTDGAHLAVNRWGTPAMARGGSGDILTGIMTALLARHLPADTLAVMQLAAMVHGLAGMRAEASVGENCVTPEEMIQAIRLD